MEGGEQGSCAARTALNRCAGLQCSSRFLAAVGFYPLKQPPFALRFVCTRSFCSFYIPSNIRHHSAVWFPPHALAESVLALTMVARCLRCHKMYEEEGGGGCYYHPGTHRGDSHYGRTGLMCGWSCCKVLPPTLIP